MRNSIKPIKIAKISSLIDLDGIYIQAIKNTNMDIAKDFRLTNVKKYQKYASQIKKK